MTTVVKGSAVVVMRDGVTVLQASDFTIPTAKITAIIGPNGSGKSTLLHAMTGLLDIDAGTLSVLG
ncbi:MAG: ATP-binding cassette domain-containing protein, partial [Microbacteriaceae bacterium]|nr:ATP-binding cassette domain-containing protein [Microbacteriaceae bacterium]